jgi:eukaryotic-like serine/threonine-protein kinase
MSSRGWRSPYAHAAGVVHRDIKPTNVIVTNDGKLKITDFGIARIASTKLTQTGTVLGTPMYMAPEQYMGSGVDHLADLFSAGVVFYELLAGKRPFDGETVQEVAYKICHADPLAPSQLSPRVPAAIDAVALRALSKAKGERFQTAHDFARAIAQAIGPGAHALPTASTLRAGSSIFTPKTLKALEAVLAPIVGPLAGTLVKRSASRASDAGELVDLLRRGAGDQAESSTLLRALGAAFGSPTANASSPPSSKTTGVPVAAAAITPEMLDRVAAAPVAYVGPIAKVLVKKTSAQARDYHDLCGKLCAHLANDQERAQFMKRVGG